MCRSCVSLIDATMASISCAIILSLVDLAASELSACVYDPLSSVV